MPYEDEVIVYFKDKAKENGFYSLVYDPICKTKEEVDNYFATLIDQLAEMDAKQNVPIRYKRHIMGVWVNNEQEGNT